MGRIMAIAATVALVLLGVLVAFQVALALGAPWGSAAWGGQHRGVLPTRFRVASAVAGLAVYPLIIGLVLSAAGWISPPWLRGLGSLPMWVLAGVFGLGTLANVISSSPRERVWAPVALALAICCVILAVGATDADARPATTRLAAPAPGEVRPDYLADGSPVWVVGHDDGSVSVLSGFDTHRPYNLGKVLWWCETAKAFDNPEHGSKWDEYGFKLGGPAPTGLASYDVTIAGGVLEVGAPNEPPAYDDPATGPSASEREWCLGSDAPILYHTFEGWQAWNSPAAAVAAAPDGWILLDGRVAADAGAVFLCSLDDCTDRAFAAGIEAPGDDPMEVGALGGDRFIARVRDDALVNLTRVMPERP